MPEITDKQFGLIIEQLTELRDEGPASSFLPARALIKELEGIQQSESAIGVALSKAAPVQ